MDCKQIQTAANLYSEIIQARGLKAVRRSDQAIATDDEALEHCLWMCERIAEMVEDRPSNKSDDRDREKAMRWTCFVQGVLWKVGLRSVKEMRDDNR